MARTAKLRRSSVPMRSCVSGDVGCCAHRLNHSRIVLRS